MTSKERLDLYVRGEKTDRKPNLTIIGSVVTQYNNIGVDTYCLDYEKMVEGAILCARDTGLDFIQIASDLQREAEGFGTKLEFHHDKLPTVTRYAIDDISRVPELPRLKTRDIPRLYDIVKATKLALEKEKDIWPMTICIGPVTIAGNIRGVEQFLVDMYEEPELCRQLLDISLELILDFIDELAAVGAKYVYVPDPVASLLSPDMYNDMVFELHKKLFARMEEKGITSRLHMCGNTQALLPYTSKTGVKIIDIDHAVDYAKAIEDTEGRVILNGNIDPVADVYSCDAKHTYDAIMELGTKYKGHNCMFMPGCELPTDTNVDNIKAITKALTDIG